MDYKNILYDKDNVKGIARITINRPEARNALNQATRWEISEALGDLRADKDIRVLVITGAGDKAFIAGSDIKEFVDVSPIVMEDRAATTGFQLYCDIESLSIPVIAMINGYCFGGGNELAMSCDLRISSEKAKFGQQEVNLGIIPGAGATQRLPRLVGWGKAKELIYTGRIIDAAEAERIGLVDKVVAHEKLEEVVNNLCETIASKSPLAIKAAKKAINAGLHNGFEAGIHCEKTGVALCFSSEDQKEGLNAFLEKRQPKFKGR